MPELPDIELYLARIAGQVVGNPLDKVRFYSPFVLRSVGVSPADMEGRIALATFRLGKRVVIEFEDEHFILIHLMIAGRPQWQSPAPPEKKAFGKILLASLRFESGQLNLVEMSTRKRAAVHLINGREGLDDHRRDGIDVFTATTAQFTER